MLSSATTTGPSVTIGIPVYNGEAFVEQAIRSVLAQVDVDLELIISDNGSTDRTEAICREAIRGDDRATYVRCQENRGAAWNFNRVVDLASGTYFKWAAHDDVLAPTFLRRCVEVLEEQPLVALSYTMASLINDQGTAVDQYRPLRYAMAPTPEVRGRDVLSNPSACYECFGVMRLEQLRRTGLIGSFASSDRVLLFEIALQGQFQEVPEVLFHHRQHTSRSVHSFNGARAREAWFDPSRGGRVTLPRWRLLVEYARAVGRAPLGARERLAVMATLGPWVGTRVRPLLRDLAAWVWHRGALRTARLVLSSRAS